MILLIILAIVAVTIIVLLSQPGQLPNAPSGPSGANQIIPGPGATPAAPETPPPPLDREGAQDLLIEKVLAGAQEEFVAYLCDEPLQSGDVVVAEGGTDVTPRTISEPTYFAYIDDNPVAFFEHDVRYVFIDVASGNETVVEASWWPDINNESIWESDKCNIVEIQKNG